MLAEGRQSGGFIVTHILSHIVMNAFDFPTLPLGEPAQGAHAPVFVCTGSTNHAGRATLEMAFQEAAQDVDFFSYLD